MSKRLTLQNVQFTKFNPNGEFGHTSPFVHQIAEQLKELAPGEAARAVFPTQGEALAVRSRLNQVAKKLGWQPLFRCKVEPVSNSDPNGGTSFVLKVLRLA